VIADILYRCLHPDPAKRPTAVDLHRALTGDGAGIAEDAESARRREEEERKRRAEAERKAKEDEDSKKKADEARGREVERIADEIRRRDEEERKKKEAEMVAARIVLASPDGTTQSVGARVVFGRIVLAKFGDASKYAANEQFILDRTGDDWYIEACPNTPNDTMLNGELLSGRSKLTVGDKIGLGKAASKKTVLELTVRAE
jgi:hypothetical protein